MPNVKLILEYNGKGFHGWQLQPEIRTIQGELTRVLGIVLREDVHPVHASGRTDAGVHAKAQVASFFCKQDPDLERLTLAVSHLLRPELAVLSAEIVSDDFHPGRGVINKQYSYVILHRSAPAVLEKGRCWHVHRHLDIELMNSQAQLLLGEHDFSAFRGANCLASSPIKTIFESEVKFSPPYLNYRVVGTGFLKQMVRNIVGTLVQQGSGHLDRSMTEILNSKDRTKAGMTAPAAGLYLDWVKYEGVK